MNDTVSDFLGHVSDSSAVVIVIYIVVVRRPLTVLHCKFLQLLLFFFLVRCLFLIKTNLNFITLPSLTPESPWAGPNMQQKKMQIFQKSSAQLLYIFEEN